MWVKCGSLGLLRGLGARAQPTMSLWTWSVPKGWTGPVPYCVPHRWAQEWHPLRSAIYGSGWQELSSRRRAFQQATLSRH